MITWQGSGDVTATKHLRLILLLSDFRLHFVSPSFCLFKHTHRTNCGLSPAEEWKKREAKFSQKWSRERGLGRIAQLVQCSKNFSSLGCSTCSTLLPTLPPLYSTYCNAFLLNMQVIFSLCTNFLVGIWYCDKSINLSYGFYSDTFVLSWSKIEHKTAAELDCNY